MNKETIFPSIFPVNMLRYSTDNYVSFLQEAAFLDNTVCERSYE